MKKIFLFLATAALAVTMNSCSSDDNSDSNGGSGAIGGTITAKINGVSKTFDNVVVNQETFTEDGGYTILTITGTMGTSTNELFKFDVEKGDVGADAVYSYSIEYKSAGSTYGAYNQQFTTVVQTNSDNKLKGNFSGILNSSNGETTVNFADGAFNIAY